MPGLGRRTFAPGEVLTATNVMGYLQDQAVMNFAGTAARGSAIGTAVSEGMVSYLADSNAIQAYDGSAWKTISTLTGNVLQVVQGNSSSQITNATSTQVDTGLTATITPKFASSKILVIVQQGGCYKSAGNAGNWLLLYLYRDATSIVQTFGAYTATTLALSVGTIGFSYLDEPNTTSSITYKTRFANDFNGADVRVNFGGGTSMITLLEVAA
jgi:hypothetical protein